MLTTERALPHRAQQTCAEVHLGSTGKGVESACYWGVGDGGNGSCGNGNGCVDGGGGDGGSRGGNGDVVILVVAGVVVTVLVVVVVMVVVVVVVMVMVMVIIVVIVVLLLVEMTFLLQVPLISVFPSTLLPFPLIPSFTSVTAECRLQIGWHDLAFYDPTMYESLRKMLVDAEKADAEESFRAVDLTFCVQLRAEEGGAHVDLVKGGKHVAVTPSNVYDYVRLYAEQRMVTCSRRALQVSWA